MKMTDIVTTTEADKGFYPTPPDVANELLSGINWRFVSDILEPSAGKGNLVNAIAEKCAIHALRGYNSDCKISIDCVEIDPYLRSILRYEFGGEREKEIRGRLSELESKRDYDPTTREYKKLTSNEAEEERNLKFEMQKYRTVDVHIVHDDFMTFNTQKGYDLIVMNPPFTDGDAHLLKALELASSYGGEVRCLLNAETILNPYTNRRKLLARKLDELGAEVSFIHNAFKNAERNTDVSVAVIKAKVPAKQYESTIYERLKKAANVDEIENEVTDIAIENYLENIVARFNLEMKSGIALIDEYNGLRPYILEEVSGSYNYPNLTLCVGDPGRLSRAELPSRNKFVKLTRKKYWQALLSNPDFMAKMTTNIRKKYIGMVKKMQEYDFSLFNIQQIMVEMNAELSKRVQDTIIALFDKMTQEYSWYPETQKNVHYYNGWKTNKVHKINNKVILPTYGMLASYSWDKKDTFDLHKAEETISDIEKVFDYLDGHMTADVNLHGVLQAAHDEGRNKNIICKYFTVTLYKKGTMHIKFLNQDLVDRFNIYCCQKKGWLPPNYGRTKYSDMTKDEKAVVDGFHGDGAEGAGAQAYAKVMERCAYFLNEPTANKFQALPGRHTENINDNTNSN